VSDGIDYRLSLQLRLQRESYTSETPVTGLLEISERVRQGQVSPVMLTQQCLDRIDKLNPTLNAFITVTAESALAQARQAESEIQQGRWRGPLHGIPIGLKDLIDFAGVPTTAGSALLRDRVATEDAPLAARLRRAGAVFLGKQNLHEFAYGGSSMISYFGVVRNPRNPVQIAGGSSGGSAAAVAAELGFAAIGTDTAGSIREPAALCGIVGLKPAYGRVDTQGIIPLSPSLDHAGPLTRTVADAALMLQIIADPDFQPMSGLAISDLLRSITEGAEGFVLGVPRRFFFEGLDEEVSSAVEGALWALRKITHGLHEVDLPVSTDRTLQAAESYAYHKEWVEKSPELYQPETLRRIRTGEGIGSGELDNARRELQQLRNEAATFFKDVDALVTPTTPIPAPAVAELQRDPDQLRPTELLLLRNTRPVNVWGLPAISVPCGTTRAGLPIGLQIIGPPGREDIVLKIAYVFEREARR